ncbi:MAG: type II toxin-antitoxin system VapC family toxin [Blastocatellales bacterium]
MGLTQPLIYLDSCIIIYLVEEHQLYRSPIEARLQHSPDSVLAYTALSEMECLVIPIRNQQQAVIDKFRNWFQRANYLAINRSIFEKAAQLRADHPKLKTPDAIHLAAAQHHGCAEFWANDDRLNSIAARLAVKVI